MNGRVYDPILGRMLSTDPVVQAPEASQSYNRYSYCMNNPLKYTDPTGYVSTANHPATMASDLQQSSKFELTAKMAEMETHSGAAIGPETANNANDETVDMNEVYAQAVQDLKEGGSPLGGKIDVAFSEEQLGNNSMGDMGMLGDDGKNVSNGGAMSGVTMALTNHYQNAGGADYNLSASQFNAITSNARDNNSFNWKKARITHSPDGRLLFAVPTNFYSGNKYSQAFGNATTYFDANMQPVVFYDKWDLDTKQWGVRPYPMEFITRFFNNALNGKGFKIYYGTTPFKH